MQDSKFRGFTLIELLVVIAIMGVLTVITVSQFQTARKKARDVARKGDLNAVTKALLMYFNDYGILPDSDTINNLWGGEFSDQGYIYMKVMPTENQNGQPEYCYLVDADQKKFALLATLENTEDSEYDKYQAGYNGCSVSDDSYHFVYFSPNASIGDFSEM